MRRTFRIVFVVICFVFAGYWLMRPHEPNWRINSEKTYLLNFSADGKSFWTRKLEHQSRSSTEVVLRQISVETGLELKRHSIPFEADLDNCHAALCSNSQWISITINKNGDNDSLRNCIVNAATGEYQMIPNSPPLPLRVSSTGKWMFNPYGGHPKLIYSRAPINEVFSLESEVRSDGRDWHSGTPLFSIDDQIMAVAWYRQTKHRLDIDLASEIRLYSTDNWKQIGSVTLPIQGICRLLHWKGNQLCFQREVIENPSAMGSNFAIPKETYLVTTPILNEIPEVESFFINLSVNSKLKPDDLLDYQGFEDLGEDWYAVRHLHRTERSPWLSSLMTKSPWLTAFIEKQWPAGSMTYDFYDRATRKLRGKVDTGKLKEFRISPNGRWIVGHEGDRNQFALYSTTSRQLWPSYVSIAVGLMTLFWGFLSQKRKRVTLATDSLSK